MVLAFSLCAGLIGCAPASNLALPGAPVAGTQGGIANDAVFEAQTVFTRTDDGWNLALHHYRPSAVAGPLKDGTPVLLCHGIGFNSQLWDLDIRSRSLARYLCGQGFDVWTVDLRGAGESTKSGWITRKDFLQGKAEKVGRFGKEDWTLDDSIHLDIPAVLKFLRLHTRHKQVHWVGHDFGASLMAAYLCERDSSAVKSFVAVAMPMTFPKPSNALLATLTKPNGAYTLDALFNGYWYADGGRAGDGALRAVAEALLYHMPNMDQGGLQQAKRNAAEDIAPGVLEQVFSMVKAGEFLSADKGISYAKDLERLAVPAMLISGRMDNFANTVNVYHAYQTISSTDKVLRSVDRSNGFSSEYGHVDILAGKTAPSEVYPAIAQWLAERSS